MEEEWKDEALVHYVDSSGWKGEDGKCRAEEGWQETIRLVSLYRKHYVRSYCAANHL